jgi:hypothetical protein
VKEDSAVITEGSEEKFTSGKRMSGTESKLVERKNQNVSEKPMFFGGYKNTKNCASAGIKYDTGLKVV